MGVKQVDCIKCTTQQMSVIMQNDKKRRKWALFFQEINFFSGKSSTCASCVWIDSPSDQHSDKIPLDVTLARSLVHICATNRTCKKRGGLMPGGGPRQISPLLFL